MEYKRLDLAAPLLSVRRNTAASSPSTSPWVPFYKTEMKSRPVVSPGAVPFVWESSPGRPKEEDEEEISNATHEEPKSISSSPAAKSSDIYDKNYNINADNPANIVHLTPPLPNSPSESWLSHALLSLSSRNASTLPFLVTRYRPRSRAFGNGSNGGTTCRSSTKGATRHMRFAEVLTRPVSP